MAGVLSLRNLLDGRYETCGDSRSRDRAFSLNFESSKMVQIGQAWTGESVIEAVCPAHEERCMHVRPRETHERTSVEPALTQATPTAHSTRRDARVAHPWGLALGEQCACDLVACYLHPP